MKALVLGLFLSVAAFATSAMAQQSGSFCNERNSRIEFVCGYTPGGPGWVRAADGCYHRDTGMRCSNGGGGGYYPPQRPPYDPGYGGGRVTCSAQDRGWEEHSAHRSCGECLAEHGRCIETCSTSDYTCEAQGVDYRGNVSRFVGQGSDRYQAENQAIRNCSYNAGRCQILGCRSSEQVVSRRECPGGR